MPQVTVNFFGICTHIKADQFVPAPTTWAMRTVLPRADASNIEHHERLRGLEAHVATLQPEPGALVLPPGQTPPSQPWCSLNPDTRSWTLDGAVLTIVNAVPTSVVQPAVVLCIPHLVDLCDGDLPPLGPTAYLDQDHRPWAAFDFPDVELLGQVYSRGVSVGVVTVNVDGDRDGRATLMIQSMDDPTQFVTLTVVEGAEITVANIPGKFASDAPDDFLLHFLVTERIPDGAKPPGELSAALCGRFVGKNVPPNADGLSGPGCSNSTYP